eukprot:snap_masked-scaffold_28-processed-gene-4.42-mRNA-1 protein AED:0.32 eAED:0.32 QI:0/0/0/0.5/1/1/2/0/179
MDLKALLVSLRCKYLHFQRVSSILKRPLHLTKLGSQSRELLGADYLYINSIGIFDSFTRKVQMAYEEVPITQGMTFALEKLRVDFGFTKVFTIVTDNGSHFFNSLLNELAKKIGFEQYFTVAYSLWTNGSTEVLNFLILRYIRSLVSQFGLHESECSHLIPLITYILNNKEIPSRGENR